MIAHAYHLLYRPLLVRFTVLLGLTLTSACASAEKRLEQGVSLEQSGRPAEAAERYIQALRKDPSLPTARERLREAGNRAIETYLAEVAAAESTGRAEEAASQVLALDALRSDAAGVGVTLDVPAGYEARRRAVLDGAIAGALRTGRDAVPRGEWSEALRGYERAAERYLPSAQQTMELSYARFDAFAAWSEAEALRGRYRAAHERARQAADVKGIDAARAAHARDLQEETLNRGTRRVAVIPPWATESVLRQAPRDLLPELTDALEEEGSRTAPLFVDPLPAQEVQRELRRLDLSRRVLSSAEAARLGTEARAHFVLTSSLDTVHVQDTNVRSSRVRARTRSGADTAYTVEEGDRRLWARVGYAVIQPPSRFPVEQGNVAAVRTARFRRATYAGDPQTLDLSRGQRDLFESGAATETDRALARELGDELASLLVRDLYDRVVRRIE